MAEESEDIKPKLNLVINYEGNRITVKVRPTMTLKKVFDAAEKRFGKDPGTFKFRLNDIPLRPDHTPAQHEMEDGDMIDAYLEQLGG